MGFLKCLCCGDNKIKILRIMSNGNVKLRCYGCGLATNPDYVKQPEVIVMGYK